MLPLSLAAQFTGGVGRGEFKVDYVSPDVLLNVKVFLESVYNPVNDNMNTTLNTTLNLIPLSQPYNNGTSWSYNGTENVAAIPSGIVDWVLVELRDAPTPDAALSGTKLTGWPKAFFLKSDGSIVDLDGVSMPAIGNPVILNNLYVVVRHRNHLSIMSSTGAISVNNIYSYDFTTDVTKAFGGANGYKLIGTLPLRYGMVAGDIDNDGNIFVADYNSWAANAGISGLYFGQDLDMDGNIFISDYNFWASNAGLINNPVLKSAAIKSLYTSGVPK